MIPTPKGATRKKKKDKLGDILGFFADVARNRGVYDLPMVVSMRTLRKYNEHGLLFPTNATRSDICHDHDHLIISALAGAPGGWFKKRTIKLRAWTTACPTSCLLTSRNQIRHERFLFSSCFLMTKEAMTRMPTGESCHPLCKLCENEKKKKEKRQRDGCVTY